MCEYCYGPPHPAGCPNAPEVDPVLKCESGCQKPEIYHGEQYVKLNGHVLCFNCAGKLSLNEISEESKRKIEDVLDALWEFEISVETARRADRG